jgi:hypothetical protein
MGRQPLDRYDTPPHYIEPLLKLIGPLDGLSVYEPCVGGGNISKYLTSARHLVTNDINPAVQATMHHDARTEVAWPDPISIIIDDDRIDWVITNPPFADEQAILHFALVSARNVAFLARLSFLEPTRSRARLWQVHPPTDVIVLPRYSFVRTTNKSRTDSVTCCWMVFREGHSPCLSFVPPLPKENPYGFNHPDREEVDPGDARRAGGIAGTETARSESFAHPSR